LHSLHLYVFNCSAQCHSQTYALFLLLSVKVISISMQLVSHQNTHPDDGSHRQPFSYSSCRDFHGNPIPVGIPSPVHTRNIPSRIRACGIPHRTGSLELCSIACCALQAAQCTAVETGELAQLAPVERELMLLSHDQPWYRGSPATGRHNDRRSTPASAGPAMTWIDNLPANFSGRVTMLRPEYRVDVSIGEEEQERGTSSSEDDSDERIMMPLDSGIRLQARDSDYTCVTHRQYRLRELMAMTASRLRLPRIVRIDQLHEVSNAGIPWNEIKMLSLSLLPSPRKLRFHRRQLVRLLTGLCKKTIETIFKKFGGMMAYGSRKRCLGLVVIRITLR